MKNLLVALLITLFTHPALSQSVVYVPVGRNLQTFIDSLPAGTVFRVPGAVQVTNLDISKRVTIIGTGYFQNAAQATPGISAFYHIRMRPGSDGSYISGLQCSTINISANNIIIQRCYSTGNIRLGYTGLGDGGGAWTGTADNCLILQNYALRFEIVNQSSTATVHNFVVKNNIFYQGGFHLEGNISGEITNNTFRPGVGGGEAYYSFQTSLNGAQACAILPVIIRSNIMPGIVGGCPINAYPSTDFNGNVFTQNFTGLPSSNVLNADPNALFLGYPTNPNNALAPDARAQLAPNSPARGAGVGGTDAGAFGGDLPYVLSGIPSVPTINQLTVPLQIPQGGTLNVQIKARANN